MKNGYSLFDALRASLRRFVPKKKNGVFDFFI
jgi:hypothetical protein